MSEKLGNGVSRTLSALGRNFSQVVWQKGKPPLDSELNLMSQIESEKMQELLRSQVHSGFFLDPTLAPTDYITKPNWSNFFALGEDNPEMKSFLWASVNGWVFPVAGTDLFDGMSENSNAIKLNPPPASDTRVDLVFLEVWTTNVAPNPSEENKPSKDKVYRYGNVECKNNIADDIQDSTIGYETTERLQLQYRIRVFGAGEGLGSGVALDVFPDGLDDPNVLGQGTNTSPIGGMVFHNMKNELGDPSLWRAGDGNPDNELGTSDGYVYAVPLCAVFRRNHSGFVAVQNAGNAQKNGGFDRCPSSKFLASPRQGAKILSHATLTNTIGITDTGFIQVDGLIDSGIDDEKHDFIDFFVEVNGEIMRVTEFDTVSVPATIKVTERGRYGTQAKRHVSGSSVRIFNSRADGKFADEIHNDDILDLRRGLNTGDWDYTRLLLHNLRSLVQGQLKTSYKQSGMGDTEGHSVLEVSFLHAVGSIQNPNQTEPVDGPDGIRTVWSDGATIQSDITMLLDKDHLPLATLGSIPDMSAGAFWDVTADFKPKMFTVDDTVFCDGSTVFLHIGGDDGNQGARYTFRDSSERKVRFVSPKEMWNTQSKDGSEGTMSPVRCRWVGEAVFNPAAGSEALTDHLGDMYPTFESGFTKPFIFLGDVLNPLLKLSKSVGVGGDFYNNTSPDGLCEIDLGIDFDDPSWIGNDPSNKLLNDSKTLRDMLTDNGRDFSGDSSEVFLIVYGDEKFPQNNGAFKILGFGTSELTSKNASTNTRVVVEFLSEGVTQFDLSEIVPKVVSIEVRSHYCTNKGGNGFTLGTSAATITFTGLRDNQWQGKSTSMISTGSSSRTGYPSSMVLNLSLMYNSGRSAMARVADKFLRFAVVDGGSEYLRQAPSSLDINFPPEAGVPDNEIFFDNAHIQVWNRLGSLGLSSPDAPSYGGKVLAFSEQDREAEVFFDNGSKTVMFRPFLDRAMTLHSNVITAGTLIPNTYSLGHVVDGATVFESTHQVGFSLPPEFMPRFGRQDIPFYNDTTGDGSGTFLTGVNHLFTDNVDNNKNVFYLIGGFDNGGAPYVGSMLFQTGATSGLDYGVFGNITGGSMPPAGASSYQARLMSDETVISSDFGKGLRGIELPPFLGIARIYGVYDRRDFVNKGGATFESNRLTVSADPATNLLKTDVSKQTLFIRQGGANDATGLTDSHTYVVPSELIDITRSPEWSEGENFQDLEYVVECVCFGFAEGFINKNNYVLARQHAGNGAAITKATAQATPYVLTDLHMCIPSPAPKGDKAYVLTQRTVYQGDPYMTRAGAVRTVSDYEHRYGEVPINMAQKLHEPIQQTDAGGNLIVDLPNPRQFQVLASVDFYTTLGTGKIGGKMYKGSVLDIGHKEAVGSRKPEAELQMVARTFTQGQMGNTSRASLRILANVIVALAKISISDGSDTWTFIEGGNFHIGANNSETMESLALAIGASTAPVVAIWNGVEITLLSKYVGERGNQTRVSTPSIGAFSFRSPYSATQVLGSTTHAYLMGGVDINTNAGNGTSQLDLTGMTERLPLGVLLQDHDFLCENPLNDMASAFVTMPSGIRPPQTLLPLTNSATNEAERFLGVGQNIVMVDGGVNLYQAYNISSSPTGTRKFRVHRGGAGYTVSPNPEKTGAPIDFYSTNLHSAYNPILKGCVLAGKALLVRNFEEHAFAPSEPNRRVSTGDEIQMVILTHGLVGSPSVATDGLDIQGLMSPTGYGEGYSAIDRYRLMGKPMFKGRDRVPTQLSDKPIIYPYNVLLDTPNLEE